MSGFFGAFLVLTAYLFGYSVGLAAAPLADVVCRALVLLALFLVARDRPAVKA